MKKLDALIIGATGATGQQLISQLVEDADFNSISAFIDIQLFC